MVAVTLGPEKKVESTEDSDKYNVEKLAIVENAETQNVRRSFLPQLNSFLSCLSVRTGTQVIGWLYVVPFLMITVYIAGTLLSAVLQSRSPEDDVVTTENLAAIGLDGYDEALFYLAWGAINVIIAVKLLIGVRQRKAALLKPFIILLSVYIIYETYLCFVMIPVDANYFGYLFWDQMMKIYFLLIVNSHHTELLNQSAGFISQA